MSQDGHNNGNGETLHPAAEDSERDLNPGRGSLGRVLVDEEIIVADISTRMADVFRGVPIGQETTPEIIAWLQEEGALVRSRHLRQMPSGIDYEFFLHLKEIFAEWNQANTSIKKFSICHVLKGYVPFFEDFYEGRSQKQFADWICDKTNPDREYLRMTKQNINKTVKFYYYWFTKLGLKVPLPEGMRKPKSCKAMSDASLKRMREGIKYI